MKIKFYIVFLISLFCLLGSASPQVIVKSGTVQGNVQVNTLQSQLQSITVSPSTASIVVGGTCVSGVGTGCQQYSAQGDYADGSTQDLTSQCGTGWASSDTAKATISNAGLATAVGAGNTNITCTYLGVRSNTAVLTVTSGNVFAITTLSLPNGNTTSAYTAQIDSVNGTAPCTWSVTGTPIPGVTLAASSNPCAPVAFSGTPTTPGDYTFTVHGTDAGSHTASQQYSVRIFVQPPTCGPPNYLCSNNSNTTDACPLLGVGTCIFTPSTATACVGATCAATSIFLSSDAVNTTKYDLTMNPSGTDCVTQITDNNTFASPLTSLTFDAGSGTQQFSLNSDFLLIETNAHSWVFKLNVSGNCAQVVWPTPGNPATHNVLQRAVFSGATDNLIYQQSSKLAQSVTIVGGADPTTLSSATTLFDFSQCPHTGGVGLTPAGVTGWDVGGADFDIMMGMAWSQFGECGGQGCAHDMYIFKLATHQCATLYVKNPGDNTTTVDLYDWCNPDANGHSGDHANCVSATPVSSVNYPSCLWNGSKGGFHGGKLSPDGTWFNGGIQCAGTGPTAAGVLWHLGSGANVTTDQRLCNSGKCTGHGKIGDTGGTNANAPAIGFTLFGTSPTGWPNGTVTVAGPFTGTNGCEMHPGWEQDIWDAVWTTSICNGVSGTYGVQLTSAYQNELFGVYNLIAGSSIPRFGHNFSSGGPGAPAANQASNFACMYNQIILSQDGNWLVYSSADLGNFGLTGGNQICHAFMVHLQ